MRICPMCAEPINGPGVPADVYRYKDRHRRGSHTRRYELVCHPCASNYPGGAGGHDGKTAIVIRGWYGVEGRTEHACEVCGHGVLLVPDDRRTRFFCSDDCRLRARRMSEGRPAVTEAECDGCGTTFSPARSDAKYCSPACRQRAHRDRNRYTYDPSRIGEWTPKGRASQMQSLENLSLQISGTASALNLTLPGGYETDFDPVYAAELKRDMLKQLATIRRYLKRLPD